MIATLLASDIGDPDTWPEAFAYVGIAICVVVGMYVWLRYGPKDGDDA